MLEAILILIGFAMGYWTCMFRRAGNAQLKRQVDDALNELQRVAREVDAAIAEAEAMASPPALPDRKPAFAKIRAVGKKPVRAIEM